MIVCNTSPLIALSILGKVDLIEKAYGNWVVPDKVMLESTIDGKPFSEKLKHVLSPHRMGVKNKFIVSSYEIYLDSGEAEVIALAEEVKADLLLIDDKKGRRFAELKGFKVVGVAGFILKAKKLGLIAEIKPEFIKMRQAGIRISDSIYRESLTLAEEIW